MDAATTITWVRREAGLTLRALAARAGTSHATIAAYEAGRKVPNADTLAAHRQRGRLRPLARASPGPRPRPTTVHAGAS